MKKIYQNPQTTVYQLQSEEGLLAQSVVEDNADFILGDGEANEQLSTQRESGKWY